MSSNKVLLEADRKVFQASFEDGLLDIFLAAFVLMFAVGPLLSVYLGDFWSSFIFLPFWGVLYLLLRWLRKQYVQPRLGRVTFGSIRKKKMRTATIILFVLNVIFLGLGLVSFFLPVGNWVLNSFRFGAIMLILFSVSGYFMDLPHLYIYGVLLALGMPVGEWLFQEGIASHHGFPVVFGIATGIIFLRGLYKFVTLMRTTPPPPEEQSV